MRKGIKAEPTGIINEERVYIDGFGKLFKIDESGSGLARLIKHMKVAPFIIAIAFPWG